MRATLSTEWIEQLSAGGLRELAQAATERFQYQALRQLPAIALASEKFPPQDVGGELVLINGQIAVQRLPDGLECWPMEQARRLLGAALTRRLEANQLAEPDLFARLAQDLAPQPVVLYVPPRTVLSQPIRMQIASDETGWGFQRLVVIVGAQAEVSFEIEQTTACAQSSCWEWALEEQASVQVRQIDESPNGWAFTAVRAELKRTASFEWLGASRGGPGVRWDLQVKLAQEGAKATLQGFWNLSNEAQVHSHVLIEHAAPHCESNQLFKGVNGAHSCSSFEGLIKVASIAQKTNAYQLNQNLLIHPSARANSKPSLDILADDVRATHGSTTGRLEPDQLFYLVSRGVPATRAKAMLTQAFCQELLDRLPASWRNRLS
jgi:Fe-S cluster assembly protein SufD